ncbi:MAG TPA: hypothetical protein VF575_03190 [Candidatus Saccharimonadales bacterium]|jgi:hypothetical protein
MSDRQDPAKCGDQTNFNLYRQNFENDGRYQSIEAEGIFDENAFGRALHDPRSVILESRSDNAIRRTPLLTPLELLDWYNLDYHQRYAGTDVPLVYYGHVSALYEQHAGPYTQAMQSGLRRLADQRGVIVVEHTDHEAPIINRQLGALASDLAITLTPVEGPEGEITPHYHYASFARPQEQTTSSQSLSLYDAYAAGIRENVFSENDAVVAPSLSLADIEQLWSFYKPVFDGLSHDDPVQAGFDEHDFKALMQSPKCIKFLYKEQQDIINLCLFIDIRNCSWMNQFYYKQHFSEQYDAGLVYCSPGIIANPHRARGSTSMHTIGMMGRVIRRAGIEPVITFACDTESNKKVPRISQMAFQRVGIDTDFARPVGHQLFRMLRVSVS